MAARMRSAALAYRIGSPRQDSRYSAIGMSVSRRASKERAKALNSESLYMTPLCFCYDTVPIAMSTMTQPPEGPHSVTNQCKSYAHWILPERFTAIRENMCIHRFVFVHFADHLGLSTAGIRHFRGALPLPLDGCTLEMGGWISRGNPAGMAAKKLGRTT